MTFLHFLHNQLSANSSDNALHAFYAVVILELMYSLTSYLDKPRYVYIDLVHRNFLNGELEVGCK